MGLIKAGIGALGGNSRGSVERIFLLRVDAERGACNKGTEARSADVPQTQREMTISSRTVHGIAVADGQCMIIVEQGKIVEFCAEPGEFTWDNSTEPSYLRRQSRREHKGNLQG